MTGEFKTAKGWRIFIYIFSPVFVALFIYLGFISLNADPPNLTISLILLPVSIGGTLMFMYGFIETIKGRLIITATSISTRGLLGTKTLDFQDIRGFRADGSYIHIFPKSKLKKPIKVTAYIENSGPIIEWLTNSFLELDSYEASEEEKQILSDNQFGINQQSREYRLSEARRLAKYINIIGVGVAVWLWFYPRPYIWCILVAMMVPIISLGSVYVYRGLIRLDERKNSAYPSILYGFFAPGAALLVRAILDFEILHYTNLWTIVSVATIILASALLTGTKELKFSKAIDYLTGLVLVGVVFCYSFGAFVVSNCLFDRSHPEVFKAEVRDKEVSSGKTTIYYLVLGPWGPRTVAEKVSVTSAQYETTDKGDIVEIYVKQGFLETPWFYVNTD